MTNIYLAKTCFKYTENGFRYQIWVRNRETFHKKATRKQAAMMATILIEDPKYSWLKKLVELEANNKGVFMEKRMELVK